MKWRVKANSGQEIRLESLSNQETLKGGPKLASSVKMAQIWSLVSRPSRKMRTFEMKMSNLDFGIKRAGFHRQSTENQKVHS